LSPQLESVAGQAVMQFTAAVHSGSITAGIARVGAVERRIGPGWPAAEAGCSATPRVDTIERRIGPGCAVSEARGSSTTARTGGVIAFVTGEDPEIPQTTGSEQRGDKERCRASNRPRRMRTHRVDDSSIGYDAHWGAQRLQS
jgi:hypothetical protein